MSIAQIKKRFDELTAYLGRDVHGLDKVRELKDAVWAVRTRLASAETEAATAANNQMAAVADAIAAKSAFEQERIENHRLQQQVANLSRELEAFRRKENVDESDERTIENATDEAKAISVVRRLRKHIKFCPLPISRRADLVTRPVYAMSSFATDWSQQSLWNLGAAIAVLSRVENGITIEGDIHPQVGDQNADGSLAHHVVRWLRKAIHLERDPIQDKLHELKMAASDFS